jgi:predicted phosphodiesterase
MRYGVAGDVHGNLHALRTVLEALRAAGAERIVCPGDVVGYGPRPNECVEVLVDADALAVAGNHDLMAIGRLPIERLAAGGIVRTTIEWTRSAISDSTRDWLAGLPLELSTDDGLVVTHGALGDPERYVSDRPAAAAQLDELHERDPHARALLLGHTHQPMVASRGAPALDAERGVALDPGLGPWLLNAGSVGQSRDRLPLARAMVIDLDRGYAEFLALGYDLRATQRELVAAGLPARAAHLAPSRVRRLRRRLRARVRGA